MRKRRRERGAAVQASAQQEAVANAPARVGWRRFPLWAWVLIFVVPLVLSEFMFSLGGRSANMVLFPIVWIGFWAAIWYRSRRSTA